jgi:hypothetical protein
LFWMYGTVIVLTKSLDFRLGKRDKTVTAVHKGTILS